MEYYSVTKKQLPFLTTQMHLECIMLNYKSGRKRQIPYEFTYMWNLKNNNNKSSQIQRRDQWLTRTGEWGKWEGEGDQKVKRKK